MPIPIRTTLATDRDDLLVQITDDGSRTLIRAGTEDSYHSGCGAVAESRHVYLQNSGVADRLAAAESIRVLEVGLGTAMAMLMTLDRALVHQASLHYVAVETDWISATTMTALNPQGWVETPGLLQRYLDFRNGFPERPTDGLYRWNVDPERSVTVSVGDFRRWQPETRDEKFDAVYFDPFCPDSAPQLWTPECFSGLLPRVAPNGRLATYSCSRRVRDALTQAGWRVQRVAGPPDGKREVLIAVPAAS
ncbi:tRNA (5-methylaminomethyl-2-thiouridine)(34)-methyltransferase MnmD [Roseiconus nitratireducens]|nr:tRNA (5-methylaminomethyl-2-thiouridine)(34)-methyltransferase MnmD [Roseiconus nitratireducens]